MSVSEDDKIGRLAKRRQKARASGLSEDSVALAFVEGRRRLLRYDHDAGRWYRWAGTHWQEERTRLAFEWVRQLARELAEDDEKNNARVRKVSFANGVEKFAQSDRAFAVISDIWDSDAFLLGTPVGTVDLRTGIMREPDPTDYISKLAAAAPANAANCPRWLAFLDESTGGDAAMVRFLQQWCGYCLTGDTREHAFVFCYGPGKNGKSTFIGTVSGILGDYAATAAMTTFTATRFEQHPADLAALRGARMVTASETEEGHNWAEVRIKQLTGGDKISARFMRQDWFSYTPVFKLTVIGNHMPNLRNVDEAARRRINVVPFIRTPKQVDKQLSDKLRGEWPGILRWMINGCLDWQANELTPAPAIATATRSYFEDQDLFGQWLEERCCVGEHNTSKSAELFKSWSEFAQASGEQSGSRKTFASMLQRRGCIMERTMKSRQWRGLRLKVEGYDD